MPCSDALSWVGDDLAVDGDLAGVNPSFDGGPRLSGGFAYRGCQCGAVVVGGDDPIASSVFHGGDGTLLWRGAMKNCPNCGLRYPNDATHCFIDRAVLQEAVDPNIGTLIAGRYRIEGVLGEGGMATVYSARHTLHDRPVAIKLFRKDLARDPKLRERFRREATSCARLAHPHIIEILDSGETEDGTPYLVMEMLVGESLERLIARERLPLPRAVDIMVQTLTGLARAHDFQVIHRDLKPDNLFVCRGPDGSDFVKILDFGIARSMHDPRLTGTGEVFGTPQYMAPERITSIDAGPSADLYAIGVILYQLTTGELPFDSDEIAVLLLKHLQERPVPPRQRNPEIPPALEALILRLLEKDPARRPVDAHAVLKELSAIAATMPKPRPVPTMAEAVPAPMDGTKVQRAGTLAPATLERWERRVMIFGQMLSRAYPDGYVRPDLMQRLENVKASLARLAEVRQRSLQEQMKIEAITHRAREAQARFGHAMDALGQDLSRARQEHMHARELERQYAQFVQQSKGPFAEIHARLQASPAQVTPEMAALYRAGLEALERALAGENEHARAMSYLQAKEREVNDLEFQINELRAQLARLSQASEEERAQVQKQLEHLGAELATVEQTLIAEASMLANALRDHGGLRDLFAELEADVA